MTRRNPTGHFMLFLCLALLYSIVFSIAASANDLTPVRVGIYENPPKIFTDNNGKPSGFWPELMEYIASEEGWKIEWAHGTWPQCLKRLREDEIDIMPDVAYTEERSKLYAFSSETVLASWSRIYAREGATIQSILDLEGKNIAVLRSSVNVEGPEGIKELAKKFDIHCTFTEVNSYTKVFELLESKKADAGVTNKDFGNRYEKAFRVKRTPIILQPSHIQFAFPKNSSLTPYFIKRIDYHMKELKADEDSIYYQLLDKWLTVEPGKKPIISEWIKWALISIGASAFLLLGRSLILRSRVRSKTKELRQQVTERKQAEEALRRERDLAAALEEATAALIATLDFEEVLDRILEEVGRVVPNDAANIMLIEGDKARIARWRGYKRFGVEKAISKAVLHIPEVRIFQQMLNSGEPAVIPDIATYPGWVRVPVTEWVHSYVAAPIIARGEVIGFLNVDSATPGFFTKDHAEILRAFANHAAAAIENARLYAKVQQELRERKQAEEELRSSFVQLAETVSRAMESHDPYTAGHQRRVAELARAIGEKMGLSKEQCMGLYIGGLLHDIGKISIPEEILTYPGKPTEAEWAIIRAHPRRGYEILKGTKFPWPVAEIALKHHERMDGSGYPQGLKGEEILLEARIMAVADVVEAMSSNRPYRPALGIDKALSEIKKGKGRLYDPAAVDACISVFEKGFSFVEKTDERRI